jgi:hypothetical protein
VLEMLCNLSPASGEAAAVKKLDNLRSCFLPLLPPMEKGICDEKSADFIPKLWPSALPISRLSVISCSSRPGMVKSANSCANSCESMVGECWSKSALRADIPRASLAMSNELSVSVSLLLASPCEELDEKVSGLKSRASSRPRRNRSPSGS